MIELKTDLIDVSQLCRWSNPRLSWQYGSAIRRHTDRGVTATRHIASHGAEFWFNDMEEQSGTVEDGAFHTLAFHARGQSRS